MLADCPISRYHTEFKLGNFLLTLGQAKVTQSQLADNELVQLNYTHNLDTPLLKPNPTVIIGNYLFYFIGITGYLYTRMTRSL